MAAHARLKNEFTEDEKCHNLIGSLIYRICERVSIVFCPTSRWRKRAAIFDRCNSRSFDRFLCRLLTIDMLFYVSVQLKMQLQCKIKLVKN